MKMQNSVLALFPSLVEMNGKVFAVAQAQCENKNKCLFTGIASELLTLSDPNRKSLDKGNVKTQVLDTLSPDKGKCLSQSAKQADSQSVMNVRVGGPTTVVRGSDIYMLAGMYMITNVPTGQVGASDADQWGLLLVKGNVSDGASDNRIYWNDTDALTCTLFNQHHGSLAGLISSGGSGVKMNDGTLVFPVEGTKNKSETDDVGKT
ncbi:trans-sialidase, putative, partial [Trypanosoma cruzi marinkellei]